MQQLEECILGKRCGSKFGKDESIRSIWWGNISGKKAKLILLVSSKRNSIRCMACQKWVHARCTGVKKINNRMAESFECKKFREVSNGVVEEQEGMSMGDVDKVDRFCYLEDTINSGSGYQCQEDAD